MEYYLEIIEKNEILLCTYDNFNDFYNSILIAIKNGIDFKVVRNQNFSEKEYDSLITLFLNSEICSSLQSKEEKKSLLDSFLLLSEISNLCNLIE